MKKKLWIITLIFCLVMANLSTTVAQETEHLNYDEAIEAASGAEIPAESIETSPYKALYANNPISAGIFCADPTSIEVDGRLYVIGTSDQKQYEVRGPEEENTYECIKSFVVFSTDDMVNWTYHGEINVGEICPWIVNAWAPSIVSRVEGDGKTHFYMYFSNSGCGVGVITSTDILGEWEDPLGHALISNRTPGLTNCPIPFDPGVVIDDNGVGWLSFGGGKAANAPTFMPGTARIVQLGEDMISFASEFCEIPAPYFNEASELNYINGTWVYTFNNDWNSHNEGWDYDCGVPSTCSMVYMTTKTPLDSDSWEMRGEYFKNPGASGFDYSNNHTHVQKYKGTWYIIYHSMVLRSAMGISGSYRSLCIEEIEVDEESVTFKKLGGSKLGVLTDLVSDAFSINSGAEVWNYSGIILDATKATEPLVFSEKEGSWTAYRNIDFGEASGENALSFYAEVTGAGTLEIRANAPNGELLASMEVNSPSGAFTTYYTTKVAEISGVRDIYIIYSDGGMCVKNWQFTDANAAVTEPSMEPASETEEAVGSEAPIATETNSGAKGSTVKWVILGAVLLGLAGIAAVVIKRRKTS